MRDQEILEKIAEVFEDVFGMSGFELSHEMSAEDVEGWDSLSHVRVILAVERKFDMKLSNAEVDGFSCIGDLIKIIGERTA
ncbi:MAG: acyl carrier protein [Pseudomonadota bacterium]